MLTTTVLSSSTNSRPTYSSVAASSQHSDNRRNHGDNDTVMMMLLLMIMMQGCSGANLAEILGEADADPGCLMELGARGRCGEGIPFPLGEQSGEGAMPLPRKKF